MEETTKKDEQIAERTEEDKLVQANIKVVLGGKIHEIKPLVIKESREWRKKAVEVLSSLPAMISVKHSDADTFANAMQTVLSTMPDKVTDLFFSYAKDLDRKKIEETANDAELAKAFSQVMGVAFPLVSSLVATTDLLKPIKSQ